MVQYRNIRRALLFPCPLPSAVVNFKQALNYLVSLTSELQSLILRDAFSVEKQISKDGLFLSFQFDSTDLMALGLCVYHFSSSKKLLVN